MFSEPLVTEPVLLLVVMTATVTLAYIIENRYRWAKRIGSVMIVIALGIILSNLNIVTQNSPVYNIVSKNLIPISISLLLLRLNMKNLKQLDRKISLYFLLGCIGTIAGVVTTFFVFRSYVGDEAWKLGGQLTASYIGGGENAVAIGHHFDVSENYFTAAFAADNIVTALWMLICLSAPIGLSKFFTTKLPEEEIEKAKEYSEPFTAHELIPSIFYSLTAAGIIVVASEFLTGVINNLLAEFAGREHLRFPSILLVTTFSLIIAQTPLHKKFKVSYLMGSLIFNYFFFTLGAISSVSEVLRIGPYVFVFVATVVLVHAIIVFIGGKALRADLPKLLTASQACIGGPSTACALAEANEWPHLVVPGILLGILGYAIGNYAGIAMGLLLRLFN